MKLKLFEYVMLYHSDDKESKDSIKTLIIRHVSQTLAKDEKQVAMLASREIPESYLDDLDKVEILIRPF
jgi:hypothetical protein